MKKMGQTAEESRQKSTGYQDQRDLFKKARVLEKVCKLFVVAIKMTDGDVPTMSKLYKRVFDASKT